MGAKFGALVGWFGTVLGALGMILALSTAPTAWASHHHAIFVLLVAAVVVCLVIAVLGPLVLAAFAARFRWKVWRAGRHPELVLEGHIVPDTATGSRDFMFTTDDQPRRHIRTSPSPVGLRITAPFEATIWSSSVPAPVKRYGKTIFRVTEFLSEGIVIADQAPGLAIRGQVSYAALSRVVWDSPPQETAPPERPEPHPDPERQCGER